MRRKGTKETRFEQAIFIFSESSKRKVDVLDLCVAASVATRPGQGLIWDQLKNIIDDNYVENDNG